MLTAAAAVGLPRRARTTFRWAPFGLRPPQPSPIRPSRSSRLMRGLSHGLLCAVKEQALGEMTPEERKTRNEALFRDANEEIRRTQVDLGLSGQPVPFLCECDDETC